MLIKQLGIIADDLTGALDVAGVFATVGMKTFTLISDTGCLLYTSDAADE